MRYSRPIRAIYEEAERVTPREEDGSIAKKNLRPNIKALLEADAALDREVERIIAAQTELSATPPDENYQRDFGNLGFADWHPAQMILSEDQEHLIENEAAPISFKRAENLRKQETFDHARDALEKSDREMAIYEPWATAQLAAGRPVLDLTWGTCAKETDFLKRKLRQ